MYSEGNLPSNYNVLVITYVIMTANSAQSVIHDIDKQGKVSSVL